MNTFSTFQLCDPREARVNRVRFRRDTIPELTRANSFYCPIGRTPSKGWILLVRRDFDRLNTYSTSHQLDFGGITFSNLAIVEARCVSRGLETDRNALYLVEVTDARGVLLNAKFQAPTTSFYNIRAPAYPQMFYTSSMNGGTTWTWSTMLENLWLQMPLLGAWPGLPYIPLGTPEGFWFLGIPAWTALNDILDTLGMTVAWDRATYSIVRPGAADTSFAALQIKYAAKLEDDLEWLDEGALRVPQTVKVLFRRRNSVYGTEETVRYDSLQWETSQIYPVTVVVNSAAVGSHFLWSDFTVRYDENSLPLDTADAALIAAERAASYYNKLAAGKMQQTYAGALPFTTGSLVTSILWQQDFQTRAGWRTEVKRE